jgi:SecA DEAD-like domain
MFARKSWRCMARSALSIARETQRLNNTELATAIRSLRGLRPSSASITGAVLGHMIRAYIRTSGRVPTTREVVAAVAILDRGAIFLQSPAGRAIAATFAAGVAATLGRRVHVVAQDEARAIAMAEAAQATLALLDINFGVLQAGQSLLSRQHHHRQPIVFGAISQLAQDYLRDVAERDPTKSQLRRNIESLGEASGARNSPGVACDVAIIDAIDILLCESGAASVFGLSTVEDRASSLILQVTGLIGELDPRDDLVENAQRVCLSNRGQTRLSLIGRALGPPWADLSYQRQIRFAERALTARAIAPDQYRIVGGHLEPLTEAARNLLNEPADEEPGMARFLAAQRGFDHRNTYARRISLHRFASKYKRLGGTMAQSDIVCRELRHRYGLSAIPDLRRRRIRLVLASSEKEARNVFLSEVLAAKDRQIPVLIVASNQTVVVRTTHLLDEAGIRSARLSGPPMPQDTALVMKALSLGEDPVIIGPGRNLPLTLLSALGKRLRLMLVGLEDMTVPPDRPILDLPSAVLGDEPTAVLDINCTLVQNHSSRIERALLNLLAARTDGVISQAAIRALLQLALHRAARREELKRAQAFRSEEQHLISLAFAGPISRKY